MGKKNNKLEFLNEQHRLFHDNVGDIISEYDLPTDIIQEVNKYIKANNIEMKDAVDMLLYSIFTAVCSTISISYNDILDRFKDLSMCDVFISQVASMMWNNYYAQMEFDLENSEHPDENYLRLIKENYKIITILSATLYSMYFAVSCSDVITENDMFPFLRKALPENISIGVLICVYFHVMTDISFINLSTENIAMQKQTINNMIDNLKDKDEKEKAVQQNSVQNEGMEHGGKIIPFPTRSKH